jgi:Fic family protein
MMLDATRNHADPLTESRLFGWHAGLFPTRRSGFSRISVGKWRDDSRGPMRVISGPMGRERTHYEAPPADRLEAEMHAFLRWFNEPAAVDPVLKAAMAHLWFVTIHPFDDGNGRIARAIADLALTRSERSPQRFYSMSAQIQVERSAYYTMLETTQSGGVEITAWMSWFLACLHRAILGARASLSVVLDKAAFWTKHANASLNPRQIKLLNRLLDGFEGKLTSSKWAKIAKCSQDTAGRDIAGLLELGILRKGPAGGRSTSYELDIGA